MVVSNKNKNKEPFVLEPFPWIKKRFKYYYCRVTAGKREREIERE